MVPDEDQRWSLEFKDWSEDHVEQELATLQEAVECAYSAPAVVNNETVLLSPPAGTFDTFPFRSECPPDHHRVRRVPKGFPRVGYQQHMIGATPRSLPSTAGQERFPSCWLPTTHRSELPPDHHRVWLVQKGFPRVGYQQPTDRSHPPITTEYGWSRKVSLVLVNTTLLSHATRHCSRRCAELALTAVLLSGGATDGCKRS